MFIFTDIVSAKSPVRYLCSKHVLPTFTDPSTISFTSLQYKGSLTFIINCAKIAYVLDFDGGDAITGRFSLGGGSS